MALNQAPMFLISRGKLSSLSHGHCTHSLHPWCVLKMPLCQAVHTQEPDTPGHVFCHYFFLKVLGSHIEV